MRGQNRTGDQERHLVTIKLLNFQIFPINLFPIISNYLPIISSMPQYIQIILNYPQFILNYPQPILSHPKPKIEFIENNKIFPKILSSSYILPHHIPPLSSQSIPSHPKPRGEKFHCKSNRILIL